MIIAVFRSRVAEHGGEFERRYAEMSALVGKPFLVTEAMSGFSSQR